MKKKNKILPKIRLFKYDEFKDIRGKVKILYNFTNEGEFKIKQTLYSSNKYKGTIRGLHYQKKFKQSKIIKVLNGSIFDVFVNINPNSKNYGKHGYAYLDANKLNSIYIDKDYAHGFQTLCDNVDLIYLLDNKYSEVNHETILYNDNYLNIVWPIKLSKISIKDKEAKKFLK